MFETLSGEMQGDNDSARVYDQRPVMPLLHNYGQPGLKFQSFHSQSFRNFFTITIYSRLTPKKHLISQGANPYVIFQDGYYNAD